MIFKNNQPLMMPSFTSSDETEDPYGTKTCNHTSIVNNQQFTEHINSRLISPDADMVENIDFKDIDTSDEVFEKYIYYCPVVTCHNDFDQCWKKFRNLFQLG